MSDAVDNIGKDITLSRCVYKIRNMSEFSFIVVRTGRYLIQTIYSSENCKDSIDGLKEGYFVNITGTVTENEKGYNGIELILKKISVLFQVLLRNILCMFLTSVWAVLLILTSIIVP